MLFVCEFDLNKTNIKLYIYINIVIYCDENSDAILSERERERTFKIDLITSIIERLDLCTCERYRQNSDAWFG